MWEILSDCFTRHSIKKNTYAEPTEEQITLLNNYLIDNFNINLGDVNYIEVVDNYTCNDLKIRTCDDNIITKKYDENCLPNELRFHKYKFNPTSINNNIITCKIVYGSSY